MKEININNYEEYIFDWLEGKLSDDDNKAFTLFLSKNPDIQDMIESMARFQLPDNNKKNIASNLFSGLKKSINDKKVNKDNYLEFVMAMMDGELNEVSILELERYLSKNPKHSKEAEIMQLTKLSPDMNVKFKNKDVLKQKPLKTIGSKSFNKEKPVIQFSGRTIYKVIGIAASIAFIAGIFIFDNNTINDPTPPLSEQKIADAGVDDQVIEQKEQGASKSRDKISITPLELAYAESTTTVSSENQTVDELNLTNDLPIAKVQTYPPAEKKASIKSNYLSSNISIKELKSPIEISRQKSRPIEFASIEPQGRGLTIDEFSVEKIMEAGEIASNIPEWLSEMNLPKLIASTNTHEIINRTGQQIITRWIEFKENRINDLISPR